MQMTLDKARLSALFARGRPGATCDAQVTDLLSEHWETATLAWPQIGLAADVFLPYLAARLPEERWVAALRELNVADLFLACGCAHRVQPAFEAFDSVYLTRIRGQLAFLRADDDLADETRQAVSERLFVAGRRPQPRIADYDGSAPLHAWLRVIIARTAIDLLRARGRGMPKEEHDLLPVGTDPELDFLRAHCREQLLDALRAAIAALPAEDGALLRLYYRDRLTVGQIGGILSLNKSTISRRLRALVDGLRDHATAELRTKARLTDSDLASVARMAGSDLDISLRTLLGAPP
jgi:RNA polymerase sigma-70 factor (ECF subfamily)